MKTTNNDDNRITVGFDKSKWSVESPESFGEVMGILKTLFRLNNSKIEKYSLSGHRKIRKYTNGPDSVQIYYSPTDISQPSARMVNNSSNNRLSFFKISSEELLKDNFTVEISNNRTSMNYAVLAYDTSVVDLHTGIEFRILPQPGIVSNINMRIN